MNGPTLLRLSAYLSLTLPIGVAAFASPPPTSGPQAQAPQIEHHSVTTMDEDAVAYGILTNTCQGCHDLGMLARRPIAAQEWPGILDKMVSFGASLSDEERQNLMHYLTKIYSAGSSSKSTNQK